MQNFFENYLSEHCQYVSINNCSSLQRNKCRIPQCSMLGPIFFLLCINDLPNASNMLRFLIYADNTNILYENLDPKSIADAVDMEIPKAAEGFNSSTLHINTTKTVAILFHTSQEP